MIVNKSGIYIIENKINNNYYIGSSVNISTRWSLHKHHAKKGLVSCTKLYNAMRKYGIENFECKPILLCEKQDLEYYEQKLLDIHVGKDECYNISKDVKSPMRNPSNETIIKMSKKAKLNKNGLNNLRTDAMLGKHHSLLTKKMMSESHKKRDHSYKIGISRSKETKEKISKNNCKFWLNKKIPLSIRKKISNSTKNKKLTNIQVLEIRNKHMLGCSNNNLSQEYRVHPSTISGIITGRTWSHLS